MISYCARKFKEYYFCKINSELEREALSFFCEKEKQIYFAMDYYDRWHGLQVYSKLKKVTTDKVYLKFSVLHDCGKNKASFLLRILHKLKFKTRLKKHSLEGYKKLKNINYDVAKLILHHHDKNATGLLKQFQYFDDRS